jgi:predicted nucleic acid-binding protein
MAHRRELGRPIATADAMIAAIALANGCKLATRNVTDFEDTGVEVVDPFSRT